MSLAEEIILLTLDEKSGKFIQVPEYAFRYALSGATLMDLAFKGRIDTDTDSLFIINNSPTGDDVLDMVFQLIKEEKENKNCRYWIEYLGRESQNIQMMTLERLCDAGILKQEEKLVFWVFKSRRYPTIDGYPEKEVKQRIMALLFSDEIPDPRDIAIVAMADTCRIFETMFSRQEYEKIKNKILEIGKLELISQNLSKVVREIEFQLAQASTIGPM